MIGSDIEFRHLNGYLNEVSTFIAREQERFREDVKEEVRARNLTGDDVDYFYESLENDYAKWHDSFPTAIRTTVLIAACSRFETSLSEACKYLERDPRISLAKSWEQLKAEKKEKGVRLAAAFLGENYDIRPEGHAAWERILAFFHIRDAIVHAQGDLGLLEIRKSKHVREAIKSVGALGVSEDEYDRLVIEDSFIKAVLADMRDFVKAFEVALRENDTVGPVFWP